MRGRFCFLASARAALQSGCHAIPGGTAVPASWAGTSGLVRHRVPASSRQMTCVFKIDPSVIPSHTGAVPAVGRTGHGIFRARGLLP